MRYIQLSEENFRNKCKSDLKSNGVSYIKGPCYFLESNSGNDVLTVYKSNFYNVNGTYTNTITAYDARGDFIDSYDISTVLE